MKSSCDLFKGSKLLEEYIISIYFIYSEKVLKYLHIEQWVHLWQKIKHYFLQNESVISRNIFIFIYTVTAEANKLSECRRIIASIRDRDEEVTQ